MKSLAEREMGRLKQDIAQLELETERLGKQRDQQKDLLLRMEKQNIEARQRHEAMDEDWERTATAELEWERTEEAICQLCKEREELTRHWQTSVSHMTKRHQDMDLCIMSLSLVKEEVKERGEAVKMVRETLESLWRRNAEAGRWVETVSRQAAEMKWGSGEQESRSTVLYGECKVLKCAVDRTNTEVKMAQSLLAELTTNVHANKNRLEKARLHSASLEEELKTEMEVVVRAKEEAEQAEQEVKKEEKASKDADARFYGHQEVLARKAEQLQALKREEKGQQAEVSAGRSALSTMSRQQQEIERILIRKKEAVYKQDSHMELLERRMQELSAGEGRKLVELLKEEAAQVSMYMEERKRTLCFQHGELQKLEGELRLAKRDAEKLASERKSLSCKVEDLELITAATERELSEITGEKLEFMVKENLLKLEVKQANDRLQSEKDRIVSLEKQRLRLEAEFKGKEAELHLQKEAVQRQIKQVTQGCQKTRAEWNRQRCKAQKLQKKHEAIAVFTVCLEGEEVSLQQYQDEVKRQREELKQKKEELNRKQATKQREVMDLKNKLSAVRGKCEERKTLEQTLCVMQDKHTQKASHVKELKKHIKGMNMSLLHEEREVLQKRSLLQDLRSEMHAQEEELSQTLKLCSELASNIRSEMVNSDKTEEEDMDWHELQEFSETAVMLLLEVMDNYPDLRSVLKALFMERGLTLDRPSPGWDSRQSGESASTRSWDSSDSPGGQPRLQVVGFPFNH
ncbi:coiled-coil domain-containing protein 39-like isoform X2 [Anguilla rostrata]|uniref:coiled-coil domain-containing protein 39-like isoform X2 n=1 Tax=Anguilla rostrata TaxID=7938 RepID=UPI0030D09B27